jgi:hypothetical protein
MRQVATCSFETPVTFEALKLDVSFDYVLSAKHKELCCTVLRHCVKETEGGIFYTSCAQAFQGRLTLIIKTPVRTRGFGW